LLAVECASGSVSPTTLRDAGTSLRTSRDPGSLLSSWFERAIQAAQAGHCAGLDNKALDQLASEGLENPAWEYGRRQDLLHVRGELALARQAPEAAAAFFRQALMLDPRPGLALNEAAALGAAGFPEAGLDHLHFFNSLGTLPRKPPLGMQRIHEWVLTRQGYWPREIARLEGTLRSAMMSTPSRATE
jgi:protein O-mannosyl-transferase